jgi:hypothetical protein
MPEKYVRVILPSSVRLNIVNESPKVGISMYYVKEKDIRRFCEGCDKHKPDNSCLLLNDNLQGINALNGVCNLASMNHQQGRMTEGGFILGRKRRSRNQTSIQIVRDRRHS